MATQQEQPTIPASAPSVGIPGQPGWQPVPGVKLLRTLTGHKDTVRCVAFDSQDGRLASGSDDKTVKLWKVESGQLIRTLKGHTGRVFSVAFDALGDRLVSGSIDNTVKVWEVESGRLRHNFKGHKSAVCSVSFAAQGHRVASRDYSWVGENSSQRDRKLARRASE